VEPRCTIGSLHVSILKIKCQNNLLGAAVSCEKKEVGVIMQWSSWKNFSKIVRGNVLEYLC